MKNRKLPVFGWKTLLLASAIVVLLLEVFVFNLPHWNSLTKPQPEETQQTLGDGLDRLDDGTVRIEDSSQAYFEVTADDQPVEYVRMAPSSLVRYQHTVSNDTATRIDVLPTGSTEWITGRVDSFCYQIDQSTYLKNRTGYSGPVSKIRVWFQEARGSRIPVSSVIVNARVPFHIDFVRVILLLAFAAIVIAFRPRSKLHRIVLDTASTKQRLAFWLAIGVPCTAALTWAVIGNGLAQTPSVFHHSNAYVYDFNQFQQTADAILHGHAWLDLTVSPQLADSSNPYDAGVRETLLSQGAYPVYWDHVLYNGHYYSYFGVIPVILLFLPFQAITSIWTDGGLSLSTITAGSFMLCLAVVFGALYAVRFVQRHFPDASVSAVFFAFVLLFSGSTIMAPICRVDFYTIPFCAGLCMASIGLYLWQSALRVVDPSRPAKRNGAPRTRVWTVADKEGDATLVRVSKARLFWGSFFMICLLGCRPPLVALCVLLIPMIVTICKQTNRRAVAMASAAGGAQGAAKDSDEAQDEGKAKATDSADSTANSTANSTAARRTPAGLRDILGYVLVCAIPVAIVLAGLGFWNYIRFGSPLDFGNDYQLTVVDLNNYHEPLDVFVEIVFYYLFLPLKFTNEFPFITSPQTALSSWQCYEPIIGGMFAMTPLLVLLVAFPFLKRRLKEHDGWLTCWLCLGTGLLMLAFISYKGGLLWRYKIDFALYMVIIALFVLLLLLGWARRKEGRGAATAVMWVVLIATLVAGLLCFQSVFVRNVSYPIVSDQPGIFHYVRSWFQLLI